MSDPADSAPRRLPQGELIAMLAFLFATVAFSIDAMLAVALANTLFFSAATAESRTNVALYLLMTVAPFAVIAPIIGPALDRLRRGRRFTLSLTFTLRAVLAVILALNFHSLLLYPCALGMLVLSKTYGVVRASFSRLAPKHRVAAWIALLALAAGGHDASGAVASVVVLLWADAATAAGPRWVAQELIGSDVGMGLIALAGLVLLGLAGAVLGDGAQGSFHHDDTVFVTHGAERCESRQVFKKVLKNGAVGVFQGKILVKPGAQKTDGYQISQSLLLDDDSQFLAKPELEIYADDVKCSHGATIGRIDDEQLFYLRSRGITQQAAQQMILYAFAAELTEAIDDEALRQQILARIGQRLPGGKA